MFVHVARRQRDEAEGEDEPEDSVEGRGCLLREKGELARPTDRGQAQNRGFQDVREQAEHLRLQKQKRR